MKPTKEMLESVPFKYANDVLEGRIITNDFKVINDIKNVLNK